MQNDIAMHLSKIYTRAMQFINTNTGLGAMKSYEKVYWNLFEQTRRLLLPNMADIRENRHTFKQIYLL